MSRSRWSYKVVLFSPDPMRPFVLPVAALLHHDHHGEGLQVVVADPLPGRSQLGSDEAVATLHLIIRRLYDASDLHRLPPTIGPHARLDSLRQIPGAVARPDHWLQRNVLFQPTGAEFSTHEATPALLERRAWAARFFHAFRLDGHVRRRFQPAQHLGPQETAAVLKGLIEGCNDGQDAVGDPDAADVSFYGVGPGGLVLLEPLVLGHPGFRADLDAVARLFHAYRGAREASSQPMPLRLIALLLPGEQERQRRVARQVLGQTADEVLETLDPKQRRRLAEELGATAWPLAAA